MVREWFERLLHPRREEARQVSEDLACKRAATRAMLRELNDRMTSERDANVEAILAGFLPRDEDEGH